MEVVTLKPGESAPIDSDCISIDDASGGFTLTGSILTVEESLSLVNGPIYPSREAAEAEGLAWAEANGVALLYVATNS